MAVIVGPSDFDDLKRVLDARADVAAALGADLAQKVNTAAWSGPAADQYRAGLADLQRRLAGDADRLRAVSADLARLSAALSAELDHLRTVEAKVQAWYAAHPPGTPPPPPWPQGALPPSGDAQWRTVEQAFAAEGLL